MAAIANWYEQNGTATGSPAHGTQVAISSCDWKSVDDSTTPRANAPVLAGDNSYVKYIYLRFTGTFNQVGSVKFAHTEGVPRTGISLKGKITSTYETPTTASMSGSADITTPVSVSAGADVLLATSGPNGTDTSATKTVACYTQYIATQMQTSASTSAGDSETIGLTVRYTEN